MYLLGPKGLVKGDDHPVFVCLVEVQESVSLLINILTILFITSRKVISNTIKSNTKIKDYLDNEKHKQLIQSNLNCTVGWALSNLSFVMGPNVVTHLRTKKVISASMAAASASEILWQHNYP